MHLGDSDLTTVEIKKTEMNSNLHGFINYYRLDENGNLPPDDSTRKRLYSITPVGVQLGGMITGIGRALGNDDDVFQRKHYINVGFGHYDDESQSVRIGWLISKHHQRQWEQYAKENELPSEVCTLQDAVNTFYGNLCDAQAQILEEMFNNSNIQEDKCSELRARVAPHVVTDPDENPEGFQKEQNTRAFAEFVKESRWCASHGVNENVVRDALYTAAYYDVKKTEENSRVVNGDYEKAAESLYEERLREIDQEFRGKSRNNGTEPETPFQAYMRSLVAIRFDHKMILDSPTLRSMSPQLKKNKKKGINQEMQELYLATIEEQRQAISEEKHKEEYADLREWQIEALVEERANKAVLDELVDRGFGYSPVKLRRHGYSESNHDSKGDNKALLLQQKRANVFEAFKGFGAGTVVRVTFTLDPYSTSTFYGIRAKFMPQLIVVDGNIPRKKSYSKLRNLGYLGDASFVGDDNPANEHDNDFDTLGAEASFVDVKEENASDVGGDAQLVEDDDDDDDAASDDEMFEDDE